MNSKPMKVTKLVEVEVPALESKIREARLNDRRSVAKICRAIDMSPQNWYRIESGKQSVPIETIRKIESVLGVDFGVEI
ncbi:MAG: helix-turn-helix transcriptional regulator [Snowella sp.]|nr:helix-turn-helix transcriptional regulator [Snowella sp.]